jgi:hypothetical protein
MVEACAVVGRANPAMVNVPIRISRAISIVPQVCRGAVIEFVSVLM